MRKTVLILVPLTLLLIGTLWLYLSLQRQKQQIKPADTKPIETTWWEFQSVDTMKYSRDLAREKNIDIKFNNIIEKQVKDVASTGATHIAIATPYDPEFLPFLKRWVDTARKYNLSVWYRGNWSGWEGWFDYPKITREEHIKMSVQFVKDNQGLFKTGDVFSACPECENGGPGDPRSTGDVEGHKKFLIEEYKEVSEMFRLLGKNVMSNYSPMNGDVARLVMDADTTRALGGLVVVDHYVDTGRELARDLEILAELSKGKIILGEFGAPIPDIHGDMSETEQAEWLSETLEELTKVKAVKGVNYWVNIGGSTQIYNIDGSPRSAVDVLTAYYKPKVVSGYIYNEINQPLERAQITFNTNYYQTDDSGRFIIKDNDINGKATITANGYEQKEILLDEKHPNLNIILTKNNESLWFKFQKLLLNLP